MEILLGPEDISGAQAEACGYVNRALPDAELEGYVNALATRISRFDKWAIAQTKRLVNAQPDGQRRIRPSGASFTVRPASADA